MPLPDKDYSGESKHARQRRLEMCNGLVCGARVMVKEEVPGPLAMPQVVHGDAEVSKERRMHMTELVERGVFSNKTHDQDEIMLDTGRDMYSGYNIKADARKRIRPLEKTMRDLHRHPVRLRCAPLCTDQAHASRSHASSKVKTLAHKSKPLFSHTAHPSLAHVSNVPVFAPSSLMQSIHDTANKIVKGTTSLFQTAFLRSNEAILDLPIQKTKIPAGSQCEKKKSLRTLYDVPMSHPHALGNDFPVLDASSINVQKRVRRLSDEDQQLFSISRNADILPQQQTHASSNAALTRSDLDSIEVSATCKTRGFHIENHTRALSSYIGQDEAIAKKEDALKACAPRRNEFNNTHQHRAVTQDGQRNSLEIMGPVMNQKNHGIQDVGGAIHPSHSCFRESDSLVLSIARDQKNSAVEGVGSILPAAQVNTNNADSVALGEVAVKANSHMQYVGDRQDAFHIHTGASDSVVMKAVGSHATMCIQNMDVPQRAVQMDTGNSDSLNVDAGVGPQCISGVHDLEITQRVAQVSTGFGDSTVLVDGVGAHANAQLHEMGSMQNASHVHTG
eukprot:6212210-Pleurochrysis_carterae.AAC.1